MVSQAEDDGGARRLRGPTERDVFSLPTLHRSSKKQLLQLIQEYLSANGLRESAQILQREANLTIVTSTAKSLMHQTTSSGLTPNRGNPTQVVSPVTSRVGAGSVIPCGSGSVSRVLLSPQAGGAPMTAAAAATRPRSITP